MTKTVLCVTYGGGHARMVIPLIRALEAYPGIRIVSVALTTGGPMFASAGLPFLGFKDFVTPQDGEALAWGKKLLAGQHNPESGIPEEESIAYLGLSYWDLVVRLGAAEAAQLWAEKGRHAFLPLTILERIIDKIQPDMVVTTNSPRSEQAAVEVANQRGITTLSMVDLFGVYHFHSLEATYITVLCDQVIQNMQANGVTRPREAFLITGNPAFDPAFDYRGPINHQYRREHFPHIPEHAKILLWIDGPAYWDRGVHALHNRSEAEIIGDLDDLAHATKAAGGFLVIRPHPSQQRALYEQWMQKTRHPHVIFPSNLLLYPLLNVVDVIATHTSTVGVEALLMQRPVIQLEYHEGGTDMPLAEWHMAWRAKNPGSLPGVVHDAFHDTVKAAQMLERIEKLLPQEKAAPKIARHIAHILKD